MADRIRVGVIFGGRSSEHEVSLVSASSIINALDSAKYEVVPIGIAPDGKWRSSERILDALKQKQGIENEPEFILTSEPTRKGLFPVDRNEDGIVRLDVVFPVLHGTFGEDGVLQGLLELADLPYVGAGVLSSAIGMDKIIQKYLHARAGLPVAKFVWYLSSQCRQNAKQVISSIEKALRYPMFVKPANTGSSVGISKAHDRSELQTAVLLAAQFDRRIIVEQGIQNVREIEVSVLGNDDPVASIPGEVIPSNEFYDYNAKYVDGKSRSIIPARLPAKTKKDLQLYALKAFTELDGAGMARVDFFLTQKNKIYLNEVNTIPGFTSISMYPKLWEASGISFSQLVERLIDLAFERHREKGALKRSYQPEQDWYSKSD